MSATKKSAAEIFAAAIEMPCEQQLAYIADACGDDAQLRQRVEALVRAHEAAGPFMAQPAAEPPPPTRVVPAPEPDPERIGRYKLLQKIGEGGFGVVYMAEQTEPVRRRVALKIIKLGMDTRQVVARFEAERQALALMDHPNIAKVLDAGATDTGRPYFVMELVKGIKITDYCDQNKVPLSDRLSLFLQICNAIQHAHQKGIIHRDLKPSNILVTMHDGVPVPKVIDFGIAKATEVQLTDKTLFTAYEQFMGTPAYMSPEQAEMSGLDIDTRSDIYSLGVLLYELLTGRPPFDGKMLLERGIEEARRTIREVEPPRPSTRLSTLANVDTTNVATHRGTDIGKLVTQLRGDLDWIVMKCLEKDRTRRYETANGLAMDVKRYLDQEPVVARPPSRIYQFQKLVRRNKLAFTAAAAVFAALLSGLGLSTWSYLRERQARSTAVAAKTSESIQRQQAEANLAQARIEEGKAWLERAQSYLEEKNPFYAKLMAGRAIGFRGFGRENLTKAERDEFVELLTPESAETREAELILRGTDDYAPIWHGPVAKNPDGTPGRSGAGAAFSPDGKLLALGVASTNLALWDLGAGRIAAMLYGHSGSIFAIAFSPDGQYLASASHDQTIRLWDLETRNAVATFRGFSGTVQAIAFSSDSQFLGGCGESEGTIRIWLVPNGTMKFELGVGGGNRHWSLAFSPDTTLLAAGCRDGMIELWDLVTGQLRTKWNGGNSRGMYGLAFSPDGRFLASGLMDTTIRIWKMPAGELVKDLQGHISDITSVQFGPDGQTLASQDHTGIVRLWSVPNGELKYTLRPSAGRFFGSVCFSPDGSLLTSGGSMVQMWDLTSRHVEREFVAHAEVVSGLAISRDGSLLASASEDQSVGLWSASDALAKPRYLKQPSPVRSLALTPDGKQLASGGQDGVRLWSVVEGRLVTQLDCPPSTVHTLAFSPDGRRLAAGGRFGVRLWNMDHLTQSAVTLTPVEGQVVLTLAFDRTGRFLAGAMSDQGTVRGAVCVWDVERGESKFPALAPRGRFLSVSFSPDGELLVAGENRGIIDVWEMRSGELKARIPGHSDAVHSLDFSSDGRFLASASADQTIGLWGIPSGDLRARLRGHLGSVSSVVFRHDGEHLISSSEDGSIRIWNVAELLNRPLDYARIVSRFDLAGRNVAWKHLAGDGHGNRTPDEHPGDLAMESFSGRGLIAALRSGLPENELNRTLFSRFLRAGNLNSARLMVERDGQDKWKDESAALGRAYLHEAKTVLEYGSCRLAAQHAERARTFLPDKAAEAWHVTALAERGLKQWPEALAAIDKAIALEPENADFWHDKALILEEQDQRPAAREALTRAIKLARKIDENDSRLSIWGQRMEQLQR